MIMTGKFWAQGPRSLSNILIYNANNAARHCIDIAGVASSILATPTIKKPAKPIGWRVFLRPFDTGESPLNSGLCPENFFGKLEEVWADISHGGQGKIRASCLGPAFGGVVFSHRWKGGVMGQILHGSARTTAPTRAAVH